MAYYGYRLFELTLHELAGRTPLDFADCGGEHYSVVAHRILTKYAGTTVLEEKGTPSEDGQGSLDDDDFAGKRGVRVLTVERLGNTLWVDVFAGRYGDQEMAQGIPGQTTDVELKGRAPSRRYRLGFYFPAKGDRAVLAVEDISRSCPVDLVRQLLLTGSKAEAKTKEKKGKGKKKDVVEVVPMWWRLIIKPMVDDEKIDKMLAAGRTQRVDLFKHSLGAGRGRDTLEYEFSAAGMTDLQRSAVVALAADWAKSLVQRRRATSKERVNMGVPSDTQGAKELAAVFGSKIEALDFDDGFVIVEDADGKTKKISPSRLNEVFTYPLSQNGQPSDVAFHQATSETASRLAKSAKLTQMVWPAKPLS